MHEEVAQGVNAADDDLGSMVSEAKIFHRAAHSFHQEAFLSHPIDNTDYAGVLWSRDCVSNVITTDVHCNYLRRK